MIYLAYVVDHGWVVVVDLFAYYLLLDVPKIYGILVCGYPLLEQFQVVYFLPVEFRDGLLCFKVIHRLPEGNTNTIYYCTNALVA